MRDILRPSKRTAGEHKFFVEMSRIDRAGGLLGTQEPVELEKRQKNTSWLLGAAEEGTEAQGLKEVEGSPRGTSEAIYPQ